MKSAWPLKPLSSIGKVIRGVSFDKNDVRDVPGDNLLPILRAGNIQGQLITDHDLVWVPRHRVADEQLLRNGDVAIAMSSGSSSVVGKVAQLLTPWEGAVGAFCAVIRFGPSILPRFGAYWFRGPSFQAWRLAQCQGANIQNLRKTDLEAIPVPLPPMKAQERIVAILDAAEELRQLREHAERRTGELIPALFHEMFGDPATNPKGWPVVPIADICAGKYGIKAGPFGSALKKECYTTSGYRVYGQEQVIAGDFLVGDYFINQEKYESLKVYAVNPGDVLISLVGTIGKTVIVPFGVAPGIINPRLIKITPNPEALDSEYLATFITSASTQESLKQLAHGGTMGVLNAGIMKKLRVPCPPLALQHDFAARVGGIRAMETNQAESRRRLDDLFQSLLHRAFRGEL